MWILNPLSAAFIPSCWFAVPISQPPHTTNTPPPSSKLSRCCLLGSEAEWGDLAPFPFPNSL